MAKPDETTTEEMEDTPWGTWEELLLACAVNRHGTNCWDSVSLEIRTRTSKPIILTPHHCKQKYHHLQQRYTSNDGDGTVPWLDELRKLRVAELKRQLQHYDLSILSLQKKVKRLTEESENGGDRSDLGKNVEIEETPEPVVSGALDRENLETGGVKSENKAGEEKPESAGNEPVSCNGSSDSRVKEPGLVQSVKVEESMAESKSGEEGIKENSDVQSSASKSRGDNDAVHRGSMKDDEHEKGEDQSPTTEGVPVKSQPLVHFLQMVQSMKLGFVFERRLESQENLKYKNLIRQHIDLEVLQTRLKEGQYSDGNDNFFRDLLLLVNNTLIVSAKDSSESVAAIEFRQLISKEMAKRKQKTDSLPEKPLSQQASEPSDSLLLKPKISGAPMIVCRKRSSIVAKASTSSSGADRRKDQIAALAEEKQVREIKHSDKFLDEHQFTKKRTRNAFASPGKKNGKNICANPNPNKTSEAVPNQEKEKVEPSEHSETKSEKKKQHPTEADIKKQSAAKFLNRMKQNSSSSNSGSLLDTLKNSVVVGSENDSRGEEKRGGNKDDGRKNEVSRRSSGGRQLKDLGSPAKRSVGRPPKRAVALPPVSAVSGKRNRDVGETKAMASKQSKKRSRK